MDCLITKLNGRVNDGSLLKLGELRIEKKKVSSWDSASQMMYLTFNKDCEISIIGDGYFTDSTGSTNNGKTLKCKATVQKTVYVSNMDSIISIPDKYSITNLTIVNGSYNNETTKAKSIVGGLDSLKYSTNLLFLQATGTNIKGDISVLQSIKNITNLMLSNTDVEGDISDLAGLTKLKNVDLSGTKVTGDLSAFNSATNMKTLNISNTDITGDVANTANYPNLNYLTAANAKLYGDLSKLPKNIKLFIDSDNGSYANQYTWLETRNSDANIIALQYVNLGTYIDAMLINQANCVKAFGASAETNTWEKTISASGTRTSASNTAIETLKGKGYTINVPEATN